MFIPHTKTETTQMLKSIGVKSIEELFSVVPEKYRFPKLSLPEGITEMEAMAELKEYAAVNETVEDLVCFLGAGAYHHYIPAALDTILMRSEFYTAYTPYQPEISQGTLQAVFEFQTLIANLTGMDAANASHYDGATATAEAGVMAYHNFRGKRPRIVLSGSVNPQYREVVCAYLCGFENLEIETIGVEDSLKFSPDDLIGEINDLTSLVVVQYPDFFGRIFDLTKLAQAVHEKGALLAVVTNPTSMGLLKPPGEFGADIVVGEGQPLGIPLSFGGPYLGFFATKKEYVRKIAGRLVGETVDAKGNRGYVLTLTAREQHIRRDKATSNICTNQGLMALAATVYLSLLGKHGLKQVANLCYQKAHYAADQIAKIPGYKVHTDQPFFHEFVVECPQTGGKVNELLLENQILGGYELGKNYPSLPNHLLFAVTELNGVEEIDYLVSTLAEVSND